jgi:hypothetical protein
MMPRFKFEMHGLAAEGRQTWKTEGVVEAAAMLAAPNEALKASFEKLTEGRAEYGKPGVGCNGPYQITKMIFEVVTILEVHPSV